MVRYSQEFNMLNYQYTPLDENNAEIRLLTLLSADSLTAHLHIQITHVPLNLIPERKFEALSYVWGSTDSPETVYIGSKTLSVTRNLADALRHIRLKSRTRTLWIDAICVNQQDLEERGRQVQLMAPIFSRADRVVAWIGTESGDSTFALEFLEELGSAIEIDRKKGEVVSKGTIQRYETISNVAEPLWLSEREMISLLHLFQREWFHRLWVIQEIRLANLNSTILCGFKATPWMVFREAICCLWLKPFDKATMASPKTPELWKALASVHYLGEQLWHPTFMDLIVRTYDYHFSDPRDKVFALLSMVSAHEQNAGIRPDYTKSTSDVFKDAFLRFSTKSRNLRLLQTCESLSSSIRSPTWIPDWSSQRLTLPLLSGYASARSEAVFKVEDMDILCAKGVLCGKIDQIIGTFVEDNTVESLIKGIRKLSSPKDLQSDYYTGNPYLDAICRTLCSDYFEHKYVPPLSQSPKFEESKVVLQTILETDMDPLDIINITGAYAYLNSVQQYGQNRTLFVTQQGLLGIAPSNAQKGDIVAIILGCSVPMLLRNEGNGKTSVVGEAYVCGLDCGEALLGPLPDNFRIVVLQGGIDPRNQGSHTTFYDIESGTRQTKDPRVRPTEKEGEIFGHEALQQQGVDIVDIKLI